MSFHRNKKVLVTGRSGLIGSHLTFFGITQRPRFDLMVHHHGHETHRGKTTRQEAGRIALSDLPSIRAPLEERPGRSRS